ncbi:MAG: hypothetical protein HUU56_16760 [Bdellovibrionaceae bacterium]|nr:hypothetical protein [Pseudobdellovibrionaceae bacterium]
MLKSTLNISFYMAISPLALRIPVNFTSKDQKPKISIIQKLIGDEIQIEA